MGTIYAEGFADIGLSLRAQLGIHLRNNHYPPVPTSMVTPCELAIHACSDGDWERPIELPDGVLYRGEPTAPARAIAESHHLGIWIQGDED